MSSPPPPPSNSNTKKSDYTCVDKDGKPVSSAKAAMPWIIGIGLAGIIVGGLLTYSSTTQSANSTSFQRKGLEDEKKKA